MILRILMVFSLTLSIFLHGLGQQVDWGKTSEWRMYKVVRTAQISPYRLSLDSLMAFPSMKLNDDSMHLFLNDIVSLGHQEGVTWQGVFPCSVKFSNGDVHEILISVYGGFFYDVATKVFFQISDVWKAFWLEYLIDKRTLLN